MRNAVTYTTSQSALSGRFHNRGIATACLGFLPVALIAPLVFAGPPAGPATKPVEEPGAIRVDDLDAQQRVLERQRQEIDRKLAELSARRASIRAATQPSTGAVGAGPAPTEPAETTAQSPWYNAHGQATVVTQEHDAFHAPYTGPRSLPRHEGEKTSVTATLFFGLRLPWAGGEAYFDPEVAGGEGFGGVSGIASFPNGEIPRVGTPEPEPYVACLFYRQTFGLGGKSQDIPDGPNQLATTEDVSRLTVTLGKFSAVDIFQQSAYANDPRAQFLSWALFTAGAWDYPADTRGYTEGGVVEFNQENWAVRYGAMAEPTMANGGTFDSRVLNSLGQSLELEERWSIEQHPGAMRLMGFFNNSHAGNYRDAIEHPGPNGPDVTLTRRYRGKYGLALTVDQEITSDLGAFARLSWNDGHSESWAFTEIDRCATFGLSLKGTRWHRPDDIVGVAVIIDGLSKDHRDYLGAGGLGFIIGDGKLPHYAPEEVVEAYYLIKVADHIFVSPDFQLVDHPAYNHDRGPVSIVGIRAHVEF